MANLNDTVRRIAPLIAERCTPSRFLEILPLVDELKAAVAPKMKQPPAFIRDPAEIKAFIDTHMGHRLTALVSPLCRPDRFWNQCGDVHRAAQEGSYVTLRLFIEFLGVKSNPKNKDKLEQINCKDGKPDDLNVSRFCGKNGEPLPAVRPQDFGAEEGFLAEVHRTLCKINAHPTYQFGEILSAPSAFYDRVASLSKDDWSQAVEIIVQKLDQYFYQPLGEDIVVHQDLPLDLFRQKFKVASRVVGGPLGPLPS